MMNFRLPEMGIRMEISFPAMARPKATPFGTVSFQVIVDGEYLWCEISSEALLHHFSASSKNSEDLLSSFHQCNQEILETAKRYLEVSGGRSVILMKKDFETSGI